MKITLSIVVALAISLTLGLAWAAQPEAAVFNGVTYFETGLAPDCASVRGAAAGGLVSDTGEGMMTGITSFQLSLPDSYPTGLCAGSSISEEAPAPWINNGITCFCEGSL